MRVVSKLYVHKTCSAIDQAAIKDRRKIVSDVPNAKDTSKGNNPYIASLRFNSDYRYPYALARFAFITAKLTVTSPLPEVGGAHWNVQEVPALPE